MSILKRCLALLRLPYIAIIIAPLILLSPVIFTGRALFWGTPALQFVPWWSWAWKSLISGQLPLWNPLVGMGAPLIANYQSALFYPPNWLYFILYAAGEAPIMAWGQAVVVVLHLIWAGFGMIFLTRRMGLSKLAQTISGISFCLSGYLVARAGFLSINSAAAWLPWVMFGTLKVVESDQKGISVTVLGLIFGFQFLAGHAQTTWYTIILSLFWVIFLTWFNNKNRESIAIEGLNKVGGKDRVLSELNKKKHFYGQVRMSSIFLNLRYIFDWGVSVLLGIGLSAVQLFITAEYLVQSQRATAVDYEFAMTYSFWPWRLIGFVAPDLFGNPVHGDYWGYANFWEDAIYVGLLPILLAIGVLIKAIFKSVGKYKQMKHSNYEMKNYKVNKTLVKSRNDVAKFLGIVILLSFILAFGKNTPIYPWLYRNVPSFDMFRAPTRFTLWAEFAVPLLAAIGIHELRRPEGRGLYWMRLGTMAAFAVALGAGLGWYFLGDIRPTFIRATTFAGFWGLGTGFLLLFAPKNKVHPKKSDVESTRYHLIWGSAVVVWVAADLLFAGWGLNPGVDLNFYRDPPSDIRELRELLGPGRLYLPVDDEYELKFNQFFRFSTFFPSGDWHDLRAIYLPNLNMLSEFPSVNNFDPLVPGRYTRWMDALTDPNTVNTNQMMKLMDIQLVERLDLGQDYDVQFYPNEGGGRLWWLPCARYIDDEEGVLNLITSGDVDLEFEVIFESQSSVESGECHDIEEIPNIQVVEENPNLLVVEVAAETSGWLVWSEVWYPGWKAWVNGEEADIKRGDYLFRAVEVPAGQYQVIFSYRPTWFYIGGMVSIFVWLGLLGYLLRNRRKVDRSL